MVIIVAMLGPRAKKGINNRGRKQGCDWTWLSWWCCLTRIPAIDYYYTDFSGVTLAACADGP